MQSSWGYDSLISSHVSVGDNVIFSQTKLCKMILLLWGKHLVSRFNIWWYTSVGTKVVHRHLVPQMTFCHLRTRSCVPIDKLTMNINRKYRHETWVSLEPYVSIIKSVKQTFMRHENENKWIWYWSYPYIHISLYYHHKSSNFTTITRIAVLTEF